MRESLRKELRRRRRRDLTPVTSDANIVDVIFQLEREPTGDHPAARRASRLIPACVSVSGISHAFLPCRIFTGIYKLSKNLLAPNSPQDPPKTLPRLAQERAKCKHQVVGNCCTAAFSPPDGDKSGLSPFLQCASSLLPPPCGEGGLRGTRKAGGGSSGRVHSLRLLRSHLPVKGEERGLHVSAHSLPAGEGNRRFPTLSWSDLIGPSFCVVHNL